MFQFLIHCNISKFSHFFQCPQSLSKPSKKVFFPEILPFGPSFTFANFKIFSFYFKQFILLVSLRSLYPLPKFCKTKAKNGAGKLSIFFVVKKAEIQRQNAL